MRELTFEEAKKVELDLLLQVTDFCDRHNLTYFLAYGTLIGAVRHKGFIPWDDDIDILMPRKDYNELRKLFNNEMKDTNCFAVDPESNMAKHTIVKIIDNRTVKIETGINYKSGYLGVDIDVFPLDGMPDSEKEYEKWRKRLYKLYLTHLYKQVRFTGSFSRKMKTLIQKIVYGCYFTSVEGILKKSEKLHGLYPYDKCSYVGCMESYCNGKGNRTRKECFSDFVLLDFEGHKFKAPKGYDEFLTNLYGDYMQLPPEDKQVTHHGNKMYMK